jgi:hypothetical protein
MSQTMSASDRSTARRPPRTRRESCRRRPVRGSGDSATRSSQASVPRSGRRRIDPAMRPMLPGPTDCFLARSVGQRWDRRWLRAISGARKWTFDVLKGSAPPGIRTQNLRIKSRFPNVLAVLSCDVLAGEVRCVVRPVRRVMRDVAEKGDKNGDKFCPTNGASASPTAKHGQERRRAGRRRRWTARRRRRRRPTAVTLWSPGVAGLVGGDEAGSLRARTGPVGAGGGQVGPDLLHVAGAQAAGGSRRLDVIELG